MRNSKDDFTKRILLAMSVGIVTAERLRVQFAALAKEHDVLLPHVTAECM
jgi:hypothetical protein